MHSPPPTPATVRKSTRTFDRLAVVDEDTSIAGNRKRKRDHAGLITPRDTPKTTSRGTTINADETAKILFPSNKKQKFRVFEDPKTPTAFDEASPFAPGAPKHEHLDHLTTTSQHEDAGTMTYIFRGRKVIRRMPEDEDTSLIKPKRLFVKEMKAPKLSNPFEEEDDDEDFDGLELPSYHTSTSRTRLPSS